MRRSLALSLLVIAWPGTAQPPPVYFQLRSDRSFAPTEHPQVTVSSENVDALEFRLYRVNDPVAFFGKLPDANTFGGQGAETPVARTPLERLHRWKQRTRYAIRRLIRDQFGDEEHQRLIALIGRAARQPSKDGAERFAEMPLLNPQQVVRTWRVPVGKRNPWDAQVVEFDVPGPGLYIVEAAASGLRAATIVNVTPHALLQKSMPGRVMARMVDRQTGLALAGATLTFIPRSGQPQEKSIDASGNVEFAANGGGVLVGVASGGIAVVRINEWSTKSREEAVATGYVYTDRPIYRPGDAVSFRAILRGEDERGWRLPETAEIDYELQDPEGKTVERRKLNLSKFGTINAEWKSAKDAKLGYYSILLRSGESIQSGSFQVEEYKKPEYEVKALPAAARILQGARAAWTLEARYFFGEPVANAKVAYTVRRTRHWRWFGNFDPEDFEGYESGEYGESVKEGEAKLDADGKARIEIPARLNSFDEEYTIEARVTDAAKREITGRGKVVATVGTYTLFAQPEKYVYTPGEAVRVNVSARDYDNQPLDGIRFVAGGVSGVTGANGSAVVTLPPLSAGSHELKVTSRTSAGRTITESFYVWISGSFSQVERPNVEIVPDKKSYKAGETAKILIVTGVPNASVWIATEGRGLLKQETRAVEGTSLLYEIPIEKIHSPNFFLTVTFLKDGRYFTASKSIRVPSEQVFDVTLAPSKPSFKPGEPARYTIEAKDRSGKPVSAEFSLGVVDESVYGVAPDTTPAIDRAFHGPLYDRVTTDTSLNFYFFGQAGKRAMPIAGLRLNTSMAQMKPPRVNAPRVRKEFRDTAYWSPAVVTGSDGKAEVTLQFPDSITAWRATARGVTPSTDVGSAVNRVITRKDLILRLATPRFLTEDDETTISAIVNNYLESAKDTRVTIEAKGLELLDGALRQGSAAAKVETVFDFRVRARSVGSGTILVKALTDEESDAMEIEIPILPFGTKVSQSFGGTLIGRLEQKVSFPVDANAKTIEIRTMPSLAGALFGALEYLTSYPYGCTEQTLSSFQPASIVLQAIDELKLPMNDRRRIEKQITAGRQRLADMQHPDGGWGFWTSDDSSAFMTANVVAALEESGNWGPVNRDRARYWLNEAFQREKKAHPDFRAFMAYGLRDAAIIDAVWATRDALSPYGLALLAMRVEGERRAELLARLEQMVVSTDREAYWKAERDTILGIELDASVDTTAYALRLLMQAKPDSPLVPKAAQWLIDNRDDGYYWGSTKRTAAVIAGLTPYLKQSGELDPKLAVEIKANGELVWNKELTREDALSPHAAGLKLLPRTTDNIIALEASGRGKLYWSITAAHYDKKPRLDRSRALSIERQYLRELPGGSRQAFDGIARPGDTIVSRVTVRAQNQRYLAIEDPIPAGFEHIKDNPWYGAYREQRDDRSALFFDRFNGEYVVESRLKAVRPGRYRVSPARATPMYQPNVFASSDALTLEVR